MKRIAGFFFSLRTTLWLLGFLFIAFIAGAFIMPAREEFQSIHSFPLFLWLRKTHMSVTWWLWCSIGILSVITINTLCCSVEAIIKKRRVTRWLLLISPQIIHIGFLFMLLAHLSSALNSSHELAAVREGLFFDGLGDNIRLRIRDINVHTDSYGYISDWQVNIEYFLGEKILKKDILKPNKPSIRRGVNIIVKDIGLLPYKAVLIQVSRDPGASWALVGGIFFMIGIVTLIVLKIKLEDKSD